MTRPQIFAVAVTALALFTSTAFLARLHYNRVRCQAIYGANPWTGGAHQNVPWWCRTPAEDRRIREVERGAK